MNKELIPSYVPKSAYPSSNFISRATLPTKSSADEETLEYSPDLHGEVKKVFDEAYWHFFEDTASNEFEKQKIKEQEDKIYLTLLAYQTNDEERPISERQNWADAFTDLGIKIYGKPDADVARMLEQGDDSLLESCRFVSKEIGGYLSNEYGDALDALGVESFDHDLTPMEIIECFERGLIKLREKDSRWQDVNIETNDGSTLAASGKTIKVGLNRMPAKPRSVKGLFAHEVLRHVLSSLNGRTNHIEKMPDYERIEEGFAILNEFAASEQFPQKIIDRYVDIAFALGQLDNKKHTRKELVERYTSREQNRGRTDLEMVEKEAYAHANRIYRGTPGNDEVYGIFTKDAIYFTGFVLATNYIEDRLIKGNKIEDIMHFVEAGKFDPSDPDQAKYVEEKLANNLDFNA